MRSASQRLVVAAVTVICSLSTGTVARAQQGPVRAESGGIAVGGNVEHSCVGDCSIRPEQFQALIQSLQDAEQRSKELSDADKKIIAGLQHDLDLNKKQVEAALAILGENNVPPERLESKLSEIAQRFKALQDQIGSAQPGDDSQVVALKAEAQKAVDAGDLSKADALLAQIEAAQRQALDRLAANAAETAGKRGDIAMTGLRYVEAAKHFGDAAAMLPADAADGDRRIAYLGRKAGALYRQGDEFGDNAALAAAIDQWKQILVLMPPDKAPSDWVQIQVLLGVALARYGERETGTAKLEEAVAAFRAALEEATRERVLLDRAGTQNNLGNALVGLAERESGTAKLEEAVAAFRAALAEWAHERVPLQWAMTQMNLGNALATLGERESGMARLEEAVVTFRAALEEATRERVPLDWAAAKTGLGNALLVLGERESGTARFEEAVVTFRAALEEATHDRVPLDWAASETGLGNALRALGERQRGTSSLEEAVAAYRAALGEETRERVPLQWATTESNLGLALLMLGDREIGTARLEEAVDAYRAALTEYTRERSPRDWAASFGGQGVAMIVIADRTNDGAMAETALQQIRTALETSRSGGAAYLSARLLAQLPKAEAIRDRLKHK